MNAKADISPLFSWIAILLITLIVAWWFISNFSVGKKAIENISNDLRNLQAMADEACSLESYSAIYNPVVEQGTLDFNSAGICIDFMDVRRCRKTICETLVDRHLDLSGVTNVRVVKTEQGVDVVAE